MQCNWLGGALAVKLNQIWFPNMKSIDNMWEKQQICRLIFKYIFNVFISSVRSNHTHENNIFSLINHLFWGEVCLEFDLCLFRPGQFWTGVKGVLSVGAQS